MVVVFLNYHFSFYFMNNHAALGTTPLILRMGNSLASCHDPDVNSQQQLGHGFLSQAKFKALNKRFL